MHHVQGQRPSIKHAHRPTAYSVTNLKKFGQKLVKQKYRKAKTRSY